jgi:hypothetical protein
MQKQSLSHLPAGEANGIEDEIPSQRDSIRWLIGCGVALIALIAIGTVFTVANYRDRAIANAERESESVVLLLARHFDQELGDFTAIQSAFADRAKAMSSPDQFRREMSSQEVYLAVKARMEGGTDATGINIYDASGILINTTERFPAPPIGVADRHYFQVLQSSPSQVLAVELLRSRVTGKVAILIARKMVGIDGAFLGVIIRGFDPAKFEQSFASTALGQDAAISVFD